MGRKRENAPESEASLSGESVSAETTVTPRLSVQLDEHGAIAWDRMRPDTRAKLKNALHNDSRLDADVSGIPGGPGPAPAVHAEHFPPELCEVVYDSLSMLLVGLARSRGGYTAEQAAVLAFNSQEKAALVPATIKVLDKYDTSLGKYQEEIILGVLLSTILSGKLALLRKSAAIIEMAPQRTAAGESQGEK